MAPVAGMVIGTALIAAVAIRFTAVEHLRAATAAHPDACRIAEMHQAAAYRFFPGLREDSLSVRPATGVDTGLGRLRNDPRLAQAREKLHLALDLCPGRLRNAELLSIIEWLDGNESEARYFVGRQALIDGQLEAAIMQFELVLESDPEHARSRIHLALAHHQKGETARAAEIVAQHRNVFTASPRGKLIAGIVLAAQGDPTEAEILLREGLTEIPSDEVALIALAGLANRTGRTVEIADFLMSLTQGRRRTTPTAPAQASYLYKRAERWDDQERALKAALRLFPNSAELNYELSVNLWRRNRKSEARDYLTRAMEHSRPITLRLIQQSGIDPSQ
jgi:tetratricopeptide (TPR) repeat protein